MCHRCRSRSSSLMISPLITQPSISNSNTIRCSVLRWGFAGWWLKYEKFTNKLKKKFILGFDRFFLYTISMVYFKFNQLLRRMTNRNDKTSLNYLQLKMEVKRTSLLSQLFNFLMIFHFPFLIQFSFPFSINSDFYFMGIIQVSFIHLPL